MLSGVCRKEVKWLEVLGRRYKKFREVRVGGWKFRRKLKLCPNQWSHRFRTVDMAVACLRKCGFY